MRVLILFVLITLQLVVKSQDCLQADIVVLTDISSSLDNNKNNVIAALTTFVGRFNHSPGVRLSLGTFGDRYSLSNLTYDKKEAIESLFIPVIGDGSTNILDAYIASTLLLIEDRYGVHKIIIIISDGEVSDGDEVEKEAANSRAMGIMTLGICVENGDGRKWGWEFMNRVSTVTVRTEYGELADTLLEMGICI